MVGKELGGLDGMLVGDEEMSLEDGTPLGLSLDGAGVIEVGRLDSEGPFDGVSVGSSGNGGLI